MNPETLAGLAIGFLAILFVGVIANHVEAVREYERRK